MSYTPFVWHDGTTGGTLVDSTHLNRIEQGIADTAAGVDALTAAADPRRDFAPENYGATGDGVAIDRAAVQAAIDAANAKYTATGVRQTVPLARSYLLDAVNYLKADGTVNGAVSLMLKDGVILTGAGTLKVKSGSYGPGALYAVIRSASTGLSNAVIRDITVDGNRAGHTASVQCSNIVLEATANVDVLNVRSVNANGNGIMVRGTTTTAMTDARINGCVVLDAAFIGIQASQFNGLDITGNTVARCGNNCIDVYGEDGDATSNGINFRISDNRVRAGSVGIFLETVAAGVTANNEVSACTSAGIHVNRINGQPNRINIVGNTIIGGPLGLHVTGDTFGVTFRDNTVADVTTACVQLGDGGSGNCSYVFILNNTLDTATANTVPLVLLSGGQSAFNRHRGTISAKNTDRSKDTVITATTTVGNVISAANAA